MVDERLVNYIKGCRAKRFTLDQIKQVLLDKGWPLDKVNEAIDIATRDSARREPEVPMPPALAHENLYEGYEDLYEEPIHKPRHSSKMWILIPIAIIIIIAAVIFVFLILNEEEIFSTTQQPSQTQPPSSQPVIACGTDMNCFIDASENCDKASVIFTRTGNVLGIDITTDTYYEIKGIQLGKCILYMRLDRNDISYSQELIQQMLLGGSTMQEIEQAEQEGNTQADLLEGREGSCGFDTQDLTIFLAKLNAGTFSGGVSCIFRLTGGTSECTYSGDWEFANDCEGDFFSPEL